MIVVFIIVEALILLGIPCGMMWLFYKYKVQANDKYRVLKYMSLFVAGLIISTVIIFVINKQVISLYTNKGIGMEPIIQDGEMFIVTKYSKNYKNGDIIVYYNHGKRLVGRIIAHEGDSIKYEQNFYIINGKKYKVNAMQTVPKTFEEQLTKDGQERINKGLTKNNFIVISEKNMNQTGLSEGYNIIDIQDIVGKGFINDAM